VFVDEVGFSFLAKTGPTWAPRGHTPVLRRRSCRRVLSTLVGLTLEGRLYTKHFEHSMGGVDVVAGLEHLRQCIGGALVIVWDHLPAHQARGVQAYLQAHPELTIAWLPPYAPDLNPEEQCNAYVKKSLLNAVPDTVGQLRQLVNASFARLRRPQLIHSFFRHSGLIV
jgi:transposase